MQVLNFRQASKYKYFLKKIKATTIFALSDLCVLSDILFLVILYHTLKRQKKSVKDVGVFIKEGE